METELGSADLGLWPQLKTIEKGFFDRPADLSGSGTDNGSEDIKIAAAGNQYDESERVDFGTGELTPRGPALAASAPGGAGQ